jgi:alpha-D-ribose 1-methylphosphonate 5-triphosphate synthase subunit PhnI
MARAETGALIALWYRSVRGPDGVVNEVTLGEVRHGRLPLRVIHPLTGNPVDTGTVRLDIGYGLCFGHNERKAIAMANLDIACRRAHSDELEQLLLLTTDGLDSGGFLEHLKLPHYLTFRSIVDRKLAGRVGQARDTPRHPHRGVRARLPGAVRLPRDAGGPRLGTRRPAGHARRDRS